MADQTIDLQAVGSPPVSRKILVVDDEPAIRSTLCDYLSSQQYDVFCAGTGDEALKIFASEEPLLVISDLQMPGMDGKTLLKELKNLEEDVQVIIITGFATVESAIETLKGGAFDYLMKPFRLETVRIVVERALEHLSLRQSNRLLKENSLHVLEAMVKTLEQRDFYTAGHSRRVTAWSGKIAEVIGLSDHERRLIHLSGLIHDVGKIGIDDNILRKPGKLTEEEFEVIKSHPLRGVEIIAPLQFLQETIPIIRHHHESFDGSGYPGELQGEDIPLGARILSVADTFDAMTSSRAYREALPVEAAVAELERCSHTQFDGNIVSVFLGMDLDKI
jgi:response regulator RpfG family c-di-GMP phosphodiesterase